jgi:hypothetical protein
MLEYNKLNNQGESLMHPESTNNEGCLDIEYRGPLVVVLRKNIPSMFKALVCKCFVLQGFNVDEEGSVMTHDTISISSIQTSNQNGVQIYGNVDNHGSFVSYDFIEKITTGSGIILWPLYP